MSQADNGSVERMSFWEALQAGCGTARDRNNQYRFVAWCISWALTLTGVTAYLDFNESFRGTGAWLLAMIPFALSIGALLAFLKFLRDADEFMRKIQVEGLAIGFGFGVLFTLGYQVFERAGAPEMSANDAVVFMCAGWMAGQLFGAWRYR